MTGGAKGTMRYWEDIEIGTVTELGKVTMTKDEIIAFATRFDPQPFHIDEDAAKRSHFGGLIASGWHTCSAMMRLMIDAVVSQSPAAAMGSPGVDEIRWLKPVFAGDTITGRVTVMDKKASQSRPDMGSVFNRNEIFNQKGELVMTMRGIGLYKRRPAKAG